MEAIKTPNDFCFSRNPKITCMPRNFMATLSPFRFFVFCCCCCFGLVISIITQAKCREFLLPLQFTCPCVCRLFFFFFFFFFLRFVVFVYCVYRFSCISGEKSLICFEQTALAVPMLAMHVFFLTGCSCSGVYGHAEKSSGPSAHV